MWERKDRLCRFSYLQLLDRMKIIWTYISSHGRCHCKCLLISKQYRFILFKIVHLNMDTNNFIKGLPHDSAVKNVPVTQNTQEMEIRSLGWEDPLKVVMATLSSILAWRIPWTEEPGRLQPIGLQSQTRVKWLRTHAGNSIKKEDLNIYVKIRHQHATCLYQILHHFNC